MNAARLPIKIGAARKEGEMESLSSTEIRRNALRVLLRAVISVVLLVTLYYIMPLSRVDGAPSLLLFACILVLLVLAMTWQLRSIAHSPTPGLRAVELLAVVFPLVILVPAATYTLMSQANASAFSEDLTRSDALYFAITVFSTVGFGDIAPVTQPARIVVSGQILVNLVLLGIGLRLILGAVNMGKGRRRPAA